MIQPQTLLDAYASGWFPMAVTPGEIRWYSPDPRGIIPLDAFHVSRRLARLMRAGRFEIRVDSAFEDVIVACSQRPDSDGNWIDREIIESYCNLHALGHAHSVEAWQEGALVGGLYGVALVERLRTCRYALLDTQWVTDHLVQFGAIEIPRRRYLRLLDGALRIDAVFRG